MKRSLVRVLVLSLCTGGAAFAQTTSDLMPPLPTRSPGGGGYYYPGMPLPPAPSAAGGNDRSGSVSRSGDTTTGRKGYDIYDTSDVFGGVDSTPHVENDQIPDVHVVRRGDTLWEIAGQYLHNAWQWPKLWALNPSITNPHWIYPGDIIRITKETTAAAVAATPVSINDTPKRRTPVRTEGIFLRQTGFIEPDELKSAGKIVASKHENILLSSGDEAYVEMNQDRPLRVGERYTAYRLIEEVKHPVTGKKVGSLVQILGEADVKSISDGKMARVKLVDTTDPIERGYYVGPLRRQFKIVEPVPNARELQGVVLVQLRPLSIVAQDQIAFVDLGKAEGVVVGNRMFVTRRGDGYAMLLGTHPIDDPKYPREVIAEILIVDTREHVSTGFVTKSYVDSRIGDRVEARKGY